MKLYELTTELRNLLDQLSGYMETQLTPEEIKIQLDLFAGQFEFKAEQIGKMILELKANSTTIDNEIGRLTKRMQSIVTSQIYLREYLKVNMEELGAKKIKGETVTVSLVKNPPSLEILNEAEIPLEWWKSPPPPEDIIDKRGILDHFRETGEVIPGTKAKQSNRVEVK